MLRQAGGGRPGGMGTSIGHDLTTVLMRAQPAGISSHLHYRWVYRGRIMIETNNRIISGPWTISPLGHTRDEIDDRDETLDDGAIAFRMPHVENIRWLFVRAALCLQLPPDPTSRWAPFLFGLTVPLAGYVEDFHLRVSAPCRAHQNDGSLALADCPDAVFSAKKPVVT